MGKFFLNGVEYTPTDAEKEEADRVYRADREIKKTDIRRERDEELAHSVDPIVSNPLRWDSLSTDKQNEWKTYRQALLDLPAQSGFPDSVTWPTKPL